MLLKNNAIGNSESSSAAIEREYDVTLAAGGDTQQTGMLRIKGLPSISVQCESRDNTAQQVQIRLQLAIAQEGANPRFFTINPTMILLMAANNYVYSAYHCAAEFARVELITAAGVSADVRVRICCSI